MKDRKNSYSGSGKNGYGMGGKKPQSVADAKKNKNLIYIIVGGVALAALIVAAVILISTYVGYADADKVAAAAQSVARPEASAVAAVGSEQAGETESDPQTVALDPNTGAVEATPVENIRAKLKIDFEALKKQNKDTIGWIYVHDTVIDYPIVRGEDNQKYVEYGFDGKKSNNGAIFLDYRNSGIFMEQNSVVYGHNMKNGSMFHVLEEYENQEFFDTHKLMFLVTEEGIYKMDIFSVFITTELNDYRTRVFSTDAAYQKFIDTYRDKSMVETDVNMTTKDLMVTLSTCDHMYSTDSRIAVMAKLVEIKDIDTYDFSS